MRFYDTIGELLTQPIMNKDTYKGSHWKFEHPGLTAEYGYIEARKGGEFKEIMWFGNVYTLRWFLTQRWTTEFIEHAADFFPRHGIPFDRKAAEIVRDRYDGKLPVKIRQVPEGTVIPQGCVACVVESDDEDVAGLCITIETMMMRVWMPTTIATRGMRWWRLIEEYLEISGTPGTAEFKVVDFSARGCRTTEDAGVSGMAHLVNFQVTDNLMGIIFGQHTYRTELMLGYSIPASEHSVTTMWTRPLELAFYEHIIEEFKDEINPFGGRYPVSVVIDTYNQDEAVRMWMTPREKGGCGLYEKLIASNIKVVLRPDSGDPVINVVHLLDLIGNLVGFTVNEKGFRVLPDYVGLIQGDGINEETLRRILQRVVFHKWSVDNLVFGSGGGLMQHDVERDTHRFAMKASEVVINGSRESIRKEVATDPTKASKGGRFAVVRRDVEHFPEPYVDFVTIAEHELQDGERDYLETIFEHGELVNPPTFEEVRDNARYWRSHDKYKMAA
jgi:nicotinamide phosphoribosyltransferase